MTDIEKIRIQRIPMPDGQLPSELISALEQHSCQHYELGLDWLRLLSATALAQHESAYLYVARRSNSDFVVFPIILNTQSGNTTALTNFYSSIYQPLLQSGHARPLMVALLQYLAVEDRIATLSFSPLDQESQSSKQLNAALRASGWKGVHHWHCFANWIHPTAGTSYLSYYEALPSRLKNTIRRKSKRFFAESLGSIRIVHTSEELPLAIEQFESIYRLSWKQQEPFPEFIPELLRLAASKGWLRLGIAIYDKVPVAAQIWLVHNRTAYIFKLAYDESYKALSAGTVLSAHMMEYVITQDNVDCIDYLTGDDSYKQDWMSIRRERYGVAAYNPATFRGLFKWLTHSLKAAAKRILRPSGSTDTLP